MTRIVAYDHAWRAWSRMTRMAAHDAHGRA
jgi:hypothetical protein